MKDIPTPVGAIDRDQNAKLHLAASDADDRRPDHARLVVGPWVTELETATTTASRFAEQRDGTARRATEISQLLALKGREEEFETELIGTPAITWLDASERARYLIGLLKATPAARTPRRKKLIANVLEDLRRLSSAEVEANNER